MGPADATAEGLVEAAQIDSPLTSDGPTAEAGDASWDGASDRDGDAVDAEESDARIADDGRADATDDGTTMPDADARDTPAGADARDTPADPSDGGTTCSCAQSDGARAVRHTDLDCLCKVANCAPSDYDVTLQILLSQCGSGPPYSWEAVGTTVYQGCGLLGITPLHRDADTRTWIFDATTRAFVGMLYSPYDPYGRSDPCGQGAQWLWPISGGTLPADSCTEVYSEICPDAAR